jgi:pilin isopeptide linkage protein
LTVNAIFAQFFIARLIYMVKKIGIILAVLLFAIAPLGMSAANNPLHFEVRRVFTTISTTAANVFTYRLAPIEDDNPMPPGSAPVEGVLCFTFTLTGDETKTLGPIAFTRQGIYRYELYQVVAVEVPGYAYDERLYILEVHVSASLDVTLIMRHKDTTKADEFLFENAYGFIPTDPNLMTDTPIVKTVTGSPATPLTFTFKLAAQNIANPLPAGSDNGVKTVTITGAGTASFGKWSYTKAGAYYYTVPEVIPEPEVTGYTFDNTVYTITDTVAEQAGQLVLTRVVTNAANKPVTSLTFINSYTSPGGPTPPIGPGTGDGMNAAMYAAIFAASGALAVGAAVYLVLSGRKKRSQAYKRYEKV